jgi:phage gp36-like protein
MDENTKSRVDPEIVDLVDRIRNRHGAYGLRQLIDLAERERLETESALSALADANS